MGQLARGAEVDRGVNAMPLLDIILPLWRSYPTIEMAGRTSLGQALGSCPYRHDYEYTIFSYT
jgi:hypothetical protein